MKTLKFGIDYIFWNIQPKNDIDPPLKKQNHLEKSLFHLFKELISSLKPFWVNDYEDLKSYPQIFQLIKEKGR